MVIVVASGFLGRYLYTQVPELASGAELEELDHERFFQVHRPRLTVPMAEIDRELALQRATAQRVGRSPSMLRALWWLIFQDIGKYRGRSPAAVGSPSSASIARRATISPAAPDG